MRMSPISLYSGRDAEIHGSARGGELLGGSRGYLFPKAFLALNMGFIIM
jgi:hypothetical protein